MGCALPGALLPALLVSWHWNDIRAGSMFFVITAASAIAPLLAKSVLRVSVALGLALSALGLFLWSIGRTPPLAAAAIFGLGLGLIMTGASLQMVRGRTDGARILARLNVLWSLGAVSSPFLVERALRTGSATTVLFVLASVFAVMTIVVWFSNVGVPARGAAEPAVPRRSAPVIWLAGAALATGIEASSGAWLTSFAQRTGHALPAVVLASACFWSGMLVSRLLLASRRRSLPAWCSLRLLSLLVLGAVLVVLTATHSVLFPMATFAMGFGLGPLYPEFLARTLARGDHTHIFLAAGATSALMPYLTGRLSVATGSLTMGWTLTVFAALLLALFSWRTESSDMALVSSRL